MGMADSAKTGENARWRGRTARAHPIFDICDFILRSNSLKFQILSPLLPLNLWLDFEKMMHCPFNVHIQQTPFYLVKYRIPAAPFSSLLPTPPTPFS